MNICVLGGGTSGAITICSFIDNLIKNNISLNDISITSIHDPKIDTLKVGESLSPTILKLIERVLGYSYNEKNLLFNETLRHGTKIMWEAANGKNSVLDYGIPGLHVDSALFSEKVIYRLAFLYSSVNIIEDNISSVSQNNNGVQLIGFKGNYNFDYLIDCRGFPSPDEINSSLYSKPSHEFVNSVLIYPHFKQYNEDYSYAYVHDNGWMFGVPLSHRKAFGFCYNSNFLSEEDAKLKFRKLKNIDYKSIRKLSWTQYYKNTVKDNRIFTNGNKLYFFEPHQGLPLHYYFTIANHIIQEIIEITPNNSTNVYHNKIIKEYEILIALNYAGENRIVSKYWEESKKIAVHLLKTSESFKAWYFERTQKFNPVDYGTHDAELMDMYLSYYNIDLGKIFNK